MLDIVVSVDQENSVQQFRIIMAVGLAGDWQNESYTVNLFMAANDIESCRSSLVLLETLSKL